MNESFIATVEEFRKGILGFRIPEETMKRLKLKPFMAIEWKTENKTMVLSFSKTTKLKLNLEQKTIQILKKMMIEDGRGSIDEVINNLILWYAKKEELWKPEYDAISFIYPMDFFKKRYWTIEDYVNQTRGKK